jgi:hypothetical protein
MTFSALISQLWEFRSMVYRSNGAYALLKYFTRFFYLNNVYEIVKRFLIAVSKRFFFIEAQ